QASLEKIMSYVEIGHHEGRLLTGGHQLDSAGYFIEPTIFTDDRLAQEEIFGPVLAVIKVRNFDEALDVANNTIYGLTGSVYSRDEGHLEKARRVFHVGNLYLNHKCTGALVGVHPFGGFNMSGTDSKAGGRDYLGLFLQAKSVTRKL
ncbi:aldehyde dehydrogenase family protein, partial [Candidatus Neomarinimicrobiota bacterium]